MNSTYIKICAYCGRQINSNVLVCPYCSSKQPYNQNSMQPYNHTFRKTRAITSIFGNKIFIDDYNKWFYITKGGKTISAIYRFSDVSGYQIRKISQTAAIKKKRGYYNVIDVQFYNEYGASSITLDSPPHGTTEFLDFCIANRRYMHMQSQQQYQQAMIQQPTIGSKQQNNKLTNITNESVLIANLDPYDLQDTPVATTYIPDFPKCPNEDTDIAADTYLYDKNGKFLQRADGKSINDADATYLVRAGYERAKTTELNSENPKFHRTDREEELMFQFFYKYGQQSQKICDGFLDLAHQAYQTENPEEKLTLLQMSVAAYNAAKDWHYSKSKGAALWFQDNWECCHNTKSACFAWVDGAIEYIKDIQNEITNIRPWILEHASFGFLQTDIYKAFPDSNKSTLRNIIAQLAESGKIQKTKKGNTYFIQSNAKDNDI